MPDLRAHHHIFDGLVPDVPTAKQLHRLVDALVAATGLHAIGPVTISVRNPTWAALVMIAESHISAHGQERRAWVDVFSCQPFDVQLVYRLLGDGLGGRWNHAVVKRGIGDAA
jgi:S-adenosylmethionine/arginine decarboxylase-like enzyme